MTGAAPRQAEMVDAGRGVVIRRVTGGALNTNCYAVHAVGSRRAALVDAGLRPATCSTPAATWRWRWSC